MHGTIDIERIINDADSEYPALFQLFGGYLNQDWRTEYADPDEAVGAFKNEAPPAAVRDALHELERLRQLHLDDAALGRILFEGFELNYRPELDRVENAAWLQHVDGLLR